jgi:hypothetical protein
VVVVVSGCGVDARWWQWWWCIISIRFIKEQNELIELKPEEEEYTSSYRIQIIEDMYLYKSMW